MGWILIVIIGTLIGIIVALLGLKYSSFIYGEDSAGIIAGSFIISILLTFFIYVLGSIGANMYGIIDTYEVKVCDIQGLENNIDTKEYVKGAFILGCGYIDGGTEQKMKYYYFEVTNRGKKLASTDTNVYIRETDETSPCLIYEKSKTHFTGAFQWLFGENENERINAEILVVPNNTIKIEYNVDI